MSGAAFASHEEGTAPRPYGRSLVKDDETVESMRHASGKVDNLLDRMNLDQKGVA
jgi:hypothetical protein